MDACGQGDPFVFDVGSAFLQLAKQSPGSREGFSEDPVPLVYAYLVLDAGYGRDDILEPRHAMGWEGDRYVDRVKNPPNHVLARVP